MTKAAIDWRAKRERNLARVPDVPANEPSPAAMDGIEDPTVEADMSDAEAHRRRLIARMPSAQQKVIEKLERVKAVYVSCRRDDILTEMLSAFHTLITTKKKDGSAPGGVFYITGEPGAGKTSAISELLHHHPLMQPEKYSFGTVAPFVSVSMKGVTTVHLLARRIMRAAGYPMRRPSQQGKIWDEGRRMG